MNDNNKNNNNNPSSSSSSSSQRSNLVRSFKVMDILRKANELQQTLDDAYDEQKRQQLEQNGNDDENDNERKVVLHLEVGQPDSGAPKYVADAAIKALSSPSSSSSKKKKKNVMGYTVRFCFFFFFFFICQICCYMCSVVINLLSFFLSFTIMQDAFGLIELRQKIRQHYIEKYKLLSTKEDDKDEKELTAVAVAPVPGSAPVAIAPDIKQIVVTTGSSGGFLLAFLACFDVGDTVAIASSGYPCYRNILQALGCNIVVIPINDQSYKVTAHELQTQLTKRNNNNDNNNETKRIKGLILSSPSNPTGSMLSPTEVQDLCILCNHHDIIYISDEIYHGITYGTVPESTALEYATSTSTTESTGTGTSTTNNSGSVNTNIIVINSFSKYYSMSGWRLGWMIVPERFLDSINKLQQNMFINAPTISQTAAIAAFDPPSITELETHVAKYKINRLIILQYFINNGNDNVNNDNINNDDYDNDNKLRLLQGLSLQNNVAPADGGFYIYVDMGHDNICIYNKNSKSNNDENDHNDDYNDDDVVNLGSMTMCELLLETNYVAFTPGVDFETNLTNTNDCNDKSTADTAPVGNNTVGNRRFRISYAGSTETITSAMNKFSIFWNDVWLPLVANARQKQQKLHLHQQEE